MPYIVALSGGIASGKSTVANLFESLGVPIIDADIIARQVVTKNSSALSKIANHFGQRVITQDGELNRTELRTIVFNNDKERIWLNQLLHPIIAQETKKQIALQNTPYVLWVVPLLIENKLHEKANRILIIDTKPDVQLQRLQKRDNISLDLAKKMLSSQKNREERLAFADDVIINSTDDTDLAVQVLTLHKKYLKLSSEFLSQKK